MPDCGRPLFKLADETGDTILNSRVAHICARSEGGPRWDSEMSEADNRDAANLIPMCIEHASEIDETPARFPVELLLGWKQLQISEHQKVLKGWPLTDDEAEQVIEESFSSAGYGVAVTAATNVAAAARAVGRLTQTARQQREQTAAVAAAWREMRKEFQARMSRSWDGETGELLPPPEPSAMQTDPFKKALLESLGEAREVLRPLLIDLVAELHAVQATSAEIEPWRDWVERAADGVIAASARWPGPPTLADDENFGGALDDLARAWAGLNAAWRRESAEQPPVLPVAEIEPEESEAERQVRAHQELLDSARPWARVSTRPYEPQLYADLVKATRYAAALPKTMTNMTHGLDVTTGLAASVARNADDTTFAALIADAAEARPLATAVQLLRELMFVSQEAGRSELCDTAHQHARRLLLDADWSAREIWVQNRLHIRSLLNLTASLRSEAEVLNIVETALTADGSLLDPILRGVSEYREHRRLDDMRQLVGTSNEITNLPKWFPASAVERAIRCQYPDLSASEHALTGSASEIQRLASQFLAVASHDGAGT